MILPLILILILLDYTRAKLLDTSVSCDQINFVLSLNFDLPFSGLVYSEDGFPNCVYVNGTILSHSTYNLKIPLNGCETHINNEGNFENSIIIQENAAFLQSTDKKYLLTCIPSKLSLSPTDTIFHMDNELTEKENMITVDFGVVTVENTHTTMEIISEIMSSDEIAASASNLKYAVEIRNGHLIDSPPLSSSLNIGDKISYMVRLQKPVSNSRVGRCWASDSKSNLELSNEHGCSLQPRGNIWGEFQRLETAKEIIFINNIKAWAFPTSNEVNIFCNLRICMSRVCTFTNCTSDMTLSLSKDESFLSRARRHKIEKTSHLNDNLIDPFLILKNNKLQINKINNKKFISDLTEIETLSTHLRFRRQSIQQIKVSPMELVTASENKFFEHYYPVKLTKNEIEENNEKEASLDNLEILSSTYKPLPKKIWLIIATLALFCALMIVLLLFIATQKSEIVKIINNICR